MKNILYLIKKDVIRFLNDKPAVLLTFVVPIILIVIFANIFGGSGGPRGKVSVIFVNESNHFLSRFIESKLDSANSLRLIKNYVPEYSKDTIKLNEETAKEWVRTGKISAAVIVPVDFFPDSSNSIKLKFFYDPKNEIESNIIQGNIQQAIMTQAPNLMPFLLKKRAVNSIGEDSTAKFYKGLAGTVSKYFGVDADSFVTDFAKMDSSSLYQTKEDSSAVGNTMGSPISFESEQLVGRKVTNPGLTRTIGGWAIMFLLFSLTGAATSLFEEKQEGTLKRVMCMPVTRAQILWGKYVYSILLGCIQLMVMFLFSWALYDIDIFANFWNLSIVILASASAAVAFGMLITSFATSLGQASGISTLFILVMSSIGGSWFPVTLLPDWMQTLAKGTLTYWSVEAFIQVLWRQSSFAGIAQHVIILFTIALLVNIYSLKRFKRGLL